MANQIVVSSGAKVRNLEGVLTGTSGVVNSVPLGAANGVATLDSGGKVPVSQLPNSVMEYQGTWNANTNTPTLANGTGNAGDFYLCNVAGTTNFGAGPIAFIVGDSAIYSGSIWQKSGGATGSVTSVGLSTNGNSITIGSSPITTSGTITANFAGTNLQYVNGAGDLTTFPSLAGYVTSVTGTAPVVSSGGTTPAISMPAATTLVDGYLSAANFVTFNNKQNAITLTTTGTSGAATLIGATLNIPNYGSGLTGYVPYTGATQDVDLGAFKLNAQSLHAKGTGGLGHLGLKHQSASATASANEVSLFADSLGDLSWLNGNLYLSKFITSGNTAARSYTFPNANGTLPLLESTQTFTGANTFTQSIIINGTGTNDAYTILQSAGTSKWRIGNNYNAGANSFDIYNPITSTTPLSISSTGAITLTANVTTTGAQFVQNGLFITYVNAGALAGNTNIWGRTNGLNFALGNLTGGAGFIFQTATSYDYTFPAATGTIALVGGSGVGTVTSVAALTLGTTGTDLSSTVANGTTTPVITLNVPTASATNRGALSSADWTTFNNKQSAITNPVTGTGTTNYISKFTGTSTIGNSLIWDNGTNVGIGNTNTSYTLDVSGTGRFTGALTSGNLIFTAGTLFGAGNTGFSNRSSDTTLYLQMPATGFNITDNALNTKFILSSTGAATFYSSVTASDFISTSNVTGAALRLLGGGTSVIYQKLANDGGNYFIGISNSTGAGLLSGQSAYSFCLVTESARDMSFGTSNTERMRITSAGNVLIGTTTDSGQALRVTAAKVNTWLLTTTNNDVLRIENNSASLSASAVLLLQTTGIGAGTNSYFIYGELAGGSNTFRVYNNGNVQNTNNSYTAISDIKLKENIIDTAPKLEDLLKVRVVNYNLKEPYETHKQIGIIAQELEKIFPGLVEDTKDRNSNEITKSVKYSVFVPILIKAIQESHQIIKDLEARIVTLEQK
jgi:hypothetical protein